MTIDFKKWFSDESWNLQQAALLVMNYKEEDVYPEEYSFDPKYRKLQDIIYPLCNIIAEEAYYCSTVPSSRSGDNLEPKAVAAWALKHKNRCNISDEFINYVEQELGHSESSLPALIDPDYSVFCDQHFWCRTAAINLLAGYPRALIQTDNLEACFPWFNSPLRDRVINIITSAEDVGEIEPKTGSKGNMYDGKKLVCYFHERNFTVPSGLLKWANISLATSSEQNLELSSQNILTSSGNNITSQNTSSARGRPEKFNKNAWGVEIFRYFISKNALPENKTVMVNHIRDFEERKGGNTPSDTVIHDFIRPYYNIVKVTENTSN